jgi:hypothetical protein
MLVAHSAALAAGRLQEAFMIEKPEKLRTRDAEVVTDSSEDDHFADDTTALEASAPNHDLPQLKLRRADHDDDIPSDDSEMGEISDSDDAIDENDHWPWDHDLAEVAVSDDDQSSDEESEIDSFDDDDEIADSDSSISEQDEDHIAMSAVAADLEDHAAIEDLILSMPIVQTPIEESLAAFARGLEPDIDSTTELNETSVQAAGPTPAVIIEAAQFKDAADESCSRGRSTTVEGGLAGSGFAQPTMTPKRIGSGELVPARLTWRPGDPFGDTGESGMRRFRWDLMLTSAGVTAACGLACIWLLRTLLA